MHNVSVFHVIGGMHPGAGGPSSAVASLADAQAAMPGVSVTVLCQSVAGAPTVVAGNPDVLQRVLESRSPLALKTGEPIRQALAALSPLERPDLLVSHGLWLLVNHWAVRAARRYGIPLIIHTHGMLRPWALNHKSWRKRLAMALYQRRDLSTAQLLVASSLPEYEEFRALGLRQPVAIIPHGVSLPAWEGAEAPPLGTGRAVRTVLFLGRIYPVKGLLNLIDAWAFVRPPGWRLRLAGPDEGGHLTEVLRRARQAGVSDSIDYVGEVRGESKTSLYQGADVFVLPSFSENFGVVVVEALAHGLPVITTHGTPWADLLTFGCGWWVELGVAPLAVALREAVALSDAERRAKGYRGRMYVQRYNWADIAEQMGEVYSWVLGRGRLPDCVRLY